MEGEDRLVVADGWRRRGVEEERGGSGVTNRLLYLEWLNNTVPLYRDFNNRESPLSIL